MQRQDLERMTREQLIAQAERLGIPRPRVLTAPELIDEIVGRTVKNDRERAKARGWLGLARDLLSRVVERGLHLPEAARVLRKEGDDSWPAPPPPLPTVTLAEIYAAQGHFERALAVLDEVIAREPDHREAHAMRARFVEQQQRNRSRAGTGTGKERERDAPPVSITKESVLPPPVTIPTGQSPSPPVAPSPEAAPRVVVISAPPPPPSEAPPVQATPAAPPPADESDTEEAPTTTVSAALETGRFVVEEVRAPAAATPAPKAPVVDAVDAVDVMAATAPKPQAPAELPVEIGMASTDPAPHVAPEPQAIVATVEAPAPVAEAAAVEAPAAEVPEAVAAALPEEPPLPDRYEVDEIVAIAVDPRTLYFYWEVRPTTLAHARAAHPDGWLCVRVASFIATWEGPLADTRDLRIDGLHGDRFLRDIQPGSNLRVSVGWSSAEGFEPFAVGSEVTAPRAVPVETVAQEVARWEAEPVVAPFQNPNADRPQDERPLEGPLSRHAPPFMSPSAAIERAWSHARSTGPVDTGVAWWEGPLDDGAPTEGSPPREEEVEDDLVVEEIAGWSEGPLGSSELGRGGMARRLRSVRRRRLVPGVPGRARVPAWPAFGGASEIYPGASELPR